MAAPATKLDLPWQMGLGWGALITILTVLGVHFGVKNASTMPLGLGILAWLVFMVWLEKGVTK